MPKATIQYPKQVRTTEVSTNYSFDEFKVEDNKATTGIYLNLKVPNVEVEHCTISNNTITATDTSLFSSIPVNSNITVKGKKVLEAKIIDKTVDSLIIDKSVEEDLNDVTIVSSNSDSKKALAKITIDLQGLGTSVWTPKLTVNYFDGSVEYKDADNSNASESPTVTKSIDMTKFLELSGVPSVNDNVLDLSK